MVEVRVAAKVGLQTVAAAVQPRLLSFFERRRKGSGCTYYAAPEGSAMKTLSCVSSVRRRSGNQLCAAFEGDRKALTEAAAVVVINRHRAVIVRQNPVVRYRIILLHHRSGATRRDGPVAVVHVDHAVPTVEGAMLFHSTVLAGLARLRGRTSNRELLRRCSRGRN